MVASKLNLWFGRKNYSRIFKPVILKWFSNGNEKPTNCDSWNTEYWNFSVSDTRTKKLKKCPRPLHRRTRWWRTPTLRRPWMCFTSCLRRLCSCGSSTGGYPGNTCWSWRKKYLALLDYPCLETRWSWLELLIVSRNKCVMGEYED